MAQAATKIEDARADPVSAFELRARTRALLVREGAMDLHEAVDGLQADAECSGLVRDIGQDAVQEILAAAFRSPQ